MENWKDIPGYEGAYQASDKGRIKALKRKRRNRYGFCYKRERVLKPSTSQTGHRFVNLCLGGVGRLQAVHRLVLLTFVGPCPEGMECRHFPDRNPENNRLENLSWGTRKEQWIDKVHHGTASSVNDFRHLRVYAEGKNHRNYVSIPVKVVNKIKREYATGVSILRLSEEYGYSWDKIKLTLKELKCRVRGRSDAAKRKIKY